MKNVADYKKQFKKIVRVEKQQKTWDKLEKEGGRVEAWFKERKPQSKAKAKFKKEPQPKRKQKAKPSGKQKPQPPKRKSKTNPKGK